MNKIIEEILNPQILSSMKETIDVILNSPILTLLIVYFSFRIGFKPIIEQIKKKMWFLKHDKQDDKQPDKFTGNA